MTPYTPESGALLDRLRLRDPDALAEAIAAHARPLFRAARALGFSPTESEDLVQDVFITLLEKVDTFQGRSQLRTWLTAILHRKALERRRAHAADSRHESIDDIFESRFDPSGHWSTPPADLQRLLLSKEAGALISACLEGLSPAQRSAFTLREIEALETPEICKILEVTVTHFGVLLHRARARLRECLEAKGYTRP
jgi:RNA polymerase sigma-70 factor (ECF subfamily)